MITTGYNNHNTFVRDLKQPQQVKSFKDTFSLDLQNTNTKESTNWLEDDSTQKIKTPLKEGLSILNLISPQQAENKEPQETEAEKIARITKHFNEKFNPNKIKRNNVTEEQVAEALRRNEIVFNENGEVTDAFIRDPKRDWFLYKPRGNPWAVELNKAGLTEEARVASDYWQTLSSDAQKEVCFTHTLHKVKQAELYTGTPFSAFERGIEFPFFNSTSKEEIMNEFFKTIDKSLKMNENNAGGNSIEQVQKDKRILTEFRNTMQEVYSKKEIK
ncbi:hypothetical protein CCZ01_06295 [Helicobacter monodelphidis]|uniref:hypothetical protein n=1 Tax=Helicobacter sp. 15-1451 TaxID=2004995 RepID=UPI000DCD3641|nr:hypothetical protein [Helicobacter sp. 15-1451]RAX57444.1 hypothetical protein CCZ01_06295 [Helicobacter sp. 15-1451]